MKKLFLALMVLTLTACTDTTGSTEAIKNVGLEPVNVGGYGWFGCSEKDLWSTKFTARRDDGRVVSGIVCKGLFKGSTVRFR